MGLEKGCEFGCCVEGLGLRELKVRGRGVQGLGGEILRVYASVNRGGAM